MVQMLAVMHDVPVPLSPEWKFKVNIGYQTLAILLYSIVLIFVLHNTYKYLIVKKRYKVMTHSIFYSFAILVALGRITQHSLSFHFMVNEFLRALNNLNDGFSVCIGISQVVVVSELAFAM
jgi:hypothetical protein